MKDSLLHPGHNYHFTVTASVGEVSGEKSPREYVGVCVSVWAGGCSLCVDLFIYLCNNVLILYPFLSPGCTLQVPARPPAKPHPPKIGTRSKGSLTLRWNAPQDNGSAITSYELEWDQCKGEWEQLYSDKAKQFKFNHRFSPSTTAEFRIRACNEVGWR